VATLYMWFVILYRKMKNGMKLKKKLKKITLDFECRTCRYRTCIIL